MDAGGGVGLKQESPASEQEPMGPLGFAAEQPSSMHEQNFLALLDRFCQLEQSVDEALRQERLAREAGESVLRDLVDAERQGREIQFESLQDCLARDQEGLKAPEFANLQAAPEFANLQAQVAEHRDTVMAQLEDLRAQVAGQPAQGAQEAPHFANLQAQFAEHQDTVMAHLEELRAEMAGLLAQGAQAPHFKNLQAQVVEHRDTVMAHLEELRAEVASVPAQGAQAQDHAEIWAHLDQLRGDLAHLAKEHRETLPAQLEELHVGVTHSKAAHRETSDALDRLQGGVEASIMARLESQLQELRAGPEDTQLRLKELSEKVEALGRGVREDVAMKEMKGLGLGSKIPRIEQALEEQQVLVRELSGLNLPAATGRLEAEAPPPASWQEDVSKLAQEMKQERESREADVQDLRQLLSAAQRPAESEFDSMGDLQEFLAKEGQARELHLSSVQELLSLESEARQAHARELQGQLAAESTAREHLQDELFSALEDRLQEQGAAMEEHLSDLRRLMEEVSERHATLLEAVQGVTPERAAGSETGPEREEIQELSSTTGGAGAEDGNLSNSVEEALAEGERARERHMASVQEQLAGERSARECQHLELVERLGLVEASVHTALTAELDSLREEVQALLKEARAEEERARERHMTSVQDLLSHDFDSRQLHLDTVKEHIAGESSARDCQHVAMAERLGLVEASLHTAVGRQTAELASTRQELQAQLEAFLREGQAQQLPPAHHDELLLQHRHELEAHVSQQLETVRALLDSHREDLQAQSVRHDALCDRLSAFEEGLCESGRENDFGTADSQAIQLLHDQHRQAVADHLLQEQSAREELSRDLSEKLDGHRNALEANLRSLEICLAQEREQREQHIASVHDAIRQERAHCEALGGRHEEALAQERAVRERTHGQLRELLAGDRKPAPAPQPAEGAEAASRLASLERTLSILSTLVRTEQAERTKAFQRVWDVLDSRSAIPQVSSPTSKSVASPHRAASPSHARGAAADGPCSPTSQSVGAAARPASPWRTRAEAADHAFSSTCRSSAAAARPLSPWRTRAEAVERAFSPSAARASSPRAMYDFGASALGDPQAHGVRGPPLSSFAQRSSAALIDATAKALGSAQGLPRTSARGGMPGTATVPPSGGPSLLARAPPSPAASFMPAARATAGAATPRLPVGLGLPAPGLSGLSQAATPCSSSFRTALPAWGSVERSLAPLGPMFGQDLEEVSL